MDNRDSTSYRTGGGRLSFRPQSRRDRADKLFAEPARHFFTVNQFCAPIFAPARAVGWFVVFGLLRLCANDVPHETRADAPLPDSTLQRLLDGNARFASGHAEHPNQTVARRVEVAKAQTPYAAVLTCSDSRVSPELYLDAGLGDLFVVRDAGNTLNDHVVGSLEYAVEHLHVSLILVVGHEKCGAVSAAVAGGRAEGKISTIIEAIRPAVKSSRNQDGDRLDNAVRANARRAAMELAAASPILAAAIRGGELKIFAARYDLGSGKVELLP